MRFGGSRKLPQTVKCCIMNVMSDTESRFPVALNTDLCLAVGLRSPGASGSVGDGDAKADGDHEQPEDSVEHVAHTLIAALQNGT